MVQAMLRTATIMLLAAMVHGEAHACRINQSGPMPVCRTPATEPQERLVVIEALGRSQHTNIVVMPDDAPGPNERRPFKVDRPVHFGLFKVHIEDVGQPITLVLSNGAPLIFQIEGRVDLVQRIIVLGATSGGREAVGVTGVPSSRIENTPVISFDEFRHTSCSKPPDACVPWQFFSDQAPYMSKVLVRSGAHPFLKDNPYTDLTGVALDASDLFQHLGIKIELSDGQLVAEPITSDRLFSNLSAEERASLPAEDQYFLSTNRELAILRPDRIVSTLILTKAPVLHGWFGLRQLQAEGKLLLRDDEMFGTIYDSYVKSSPEWSADLKPPVMAILTESNIMLPLGDLHSLRNTTLGKFPVLVLEGVELSEVRASSDICFLFQIPRAHRLACKPDELFPRKRP
jgi:hypothetical protein